MCSEAPRLWAVPGHGLATGDENRGGLLESGLSGESQGEEIYMIYYMTSVYIYIYITIYMCYTYIYVITFIGVTTYIYMLLHRSRKLGTLSDTSHLLT